MRKTKTTNYVRGRNFEYRVKELLEKEGYIVFRTAGSHGLFDLIAMKRIENHIWVKFWQLKRNITHKQALKTFNEIIDKFDLYVDKENESPFLQLTKGIFKIEVYISSNRIVLFFGVIYTPTKRKTKNGKS